MSTRKGAAISWSLDNWRDIVGCRRHAPDGSDYARSISHRLHAASAWEDGGRQRQVPLPSHTRSTECESEQRRQQRTRNTIDQNVTHPPTRASLLPRTSVFCISYPPLSHSHRTHENLSWSIIPEAWKRAMLDAWHHDRQMTIESDGNGNGAPRVAPVRRHSA
jgi:hypothetical protein